jgi:hypothetical protein
MVVMPTRARKVLGGSTPRTADWYERWCVSTRGSSSSGVTYGASGGSAIPARKGNVNDYDKTEITINYVMNIKYQKKLKKIQYYAIQQ